MKSDPQNTSSSGVIVRYESLYQLAEDLAKVDSCEAACKIAAEQIPQIIPCNIVSICLP